MVFLSDAHRAELQASGLTDETIERRGYATATGREDFEWALSEKKMTRNQLGAGLVIPVFEFGHNGECSQYVVKLDSPRKIDGRVLKYEARAGFASPIDVGMQGHYPLDVDVIVTEGIKKGDCLRQVFPNALVLAVNGVHSALQVARNWQQLRQDVQEIFAGRENAKISFCFDSDVQTNPDVWQGIDRMRSALDLSGYSAQIVWIPPSGDDKVGIDDFFVARGKEAVAFLFNLASDEMPIKPVRRGERARRSADQDESEQLLQEYQTFLDHQSVQLADAFVPDLWLQGVTSRDGETIPATVQGDTLVFDSHSGDLHLFNADDCVYQKRPDGDGVFQVAHWFKKLIEHNFILVPPNRQRFPDGVEGEKAYRKAVKARISQVTAIASTMKARNVYSLLQGTPVLQKDGFNRPDYSHLFPLTGGKCIDFSKTPAAGRNACPLVDTPADALFTWCSPVTVEEYEKAVLELKEPTRMNKFVEEISDGDRRQMEAILGFLGYCLHGRRKQRFFILHGQGRNGKGVLIAILCYLLGAGAYHNKGVAKAFAGRDTRHDQHWLEHRYRRVVSAPDPTGYLNEGNLLAYAGGDQMHGEKKGGVRFC